MKPKTQKTMFDAEQISNIRNYLTSTGQDFTISISNYTTEINSGPYNIKFIVEQRGPAAFIAGKKIEKDLKTKQKPDIDVNSLIYYLHRIKGSHKFSEAIAIDIKAAYPTALLNAGYISTDTFNYLLKIPKKDRLIATGLCASRKDIFEYKAGKVVSHSEQINPLASFFFYAVKEIGEVMAELKEIAGYNFLFSWVDCLYLNKGAESLEQLERIKEYLTDRGYHFTVKTITDIIIEEKENIFNLSYYDTEAGKYKPFIIPKQNSNYKRALIQLLSKQG